MANEKKAPKNNEISAEQIAEWKKTKSNVKEISIQVDEEDMSDNAEVAKFIICAPTRKIQEAINKYAADKNIDAINKLLVTNCVLGGDMEYLSEDGDLGIYLAVLEEVGKLMKKQRVTSRRL
jgi:ribosomal protein S20